MADWLGRLFQGTKSVDATLYSVILLVQTAIEKLNCGSGLLVLKLGGS